MTGGSRGIGAAICKMFAQNGANIALLYAGNTQKQKKQSRTFADGCQSGSVSV